MIRIWYNSPAKISPLSPLSPLSPVSLRGSHKLLPSCTSAPGASQSCKLPTASKSEAIQTRTRKARVLRQSAQADIVCVAAISNRQVLWQKRDAPSAPLLNYPL